MESFEHLLDDHYISDDDDRTRFIFDPFYLENRAQALLAEGHNHFAPPPNGRALPLLPREVIALIWRDLAKLLSYDVLRFRSCKLNRANNQVSMIKDEAIRIVEVDNTGRNPLFAIPMSKDRKLFMEFLKEVGPTLVFRFFSPQGLHEFSKRFNSYFDNNPALMPTLHFDFTVIAPQDVKLVQEHRDIKEIILTYGYVPKWPWTEPVDAYDALDAWTDGLKNFPVAHDLYINLAHPWKAVDKLHIATTCLRCPSRHKIKVIMSLREWPEFPRYPGDQSLIIRNILALQGQGDYGSDGKSAADEVIEFGIRPALPKFATWKWVREDCRPPNRWGPEYRLRPLYSRKKEEKQWKLE